MTSFRKHRFVLKPSHILRFRLSRGTFSLREAKILKLAAKFIVLGDEEEILLKPAQCMEHSDIGSH